MKQRNVFIGSSEWSKLVDIGMDMQSKGVEVKDARGQLSKAAVIRELIKAYDLPAKPKGKTS